MVACCRLVFPDGEVEVTKQSFATTRKGWPPFSAMPRSAPWPWRRPGSTGAPYYALEGLFDELWLCPST